MKPFLYAVLVASTALVPIAAIAQQPQPLQTQQPQLLQTQPLQAQPAQPSQMQPAQPMQAQPAPAQQQPAQPLQAQPAQPSQAAPIPPMQTQPAQQAIAPAPSAVDFVQQAAVGGLFEVRSSEIALQRSTTPQIQAFARQMIEDHMAADQTLRQLAEGYVVPTELDADHAARLQRLEAATGPQFDPLYVGEQVDAHEKAIALFNQFAQAGQDERLRGFAQETLPTLQAHLRDAQHLQRNIVAGPVAAAGAAPAQVPDRNVGPGFAQGEPQRQRQVDQQAQQVLDTRVQQQAGAVERQVPVPGTAILPGQDQFATARQRLGVGAVETTAGIATGTPVAMAVSDIEGREIFNFRGERLGIIDSVMRDPRSQQMYVAIAHGGTLGVGQADAIVPAERLYIQGDRMLVRGVTEADLQALAGGGRQGFGRVDAGGRVNVFRGD